MHVVSILDRPRLGQELITEYVQATAVEMEAEPSSFIPFIEGYADFPGAFGSGGDFLVARSEGRNAGCVGIKPLTPEVCEMKSLWVRPEHRGKGVARALITRALQRAAALGFTIMELDVLPSRVGAIRLYRALGFEQGPANQEYTFEMVGFRKALS